MDGMDFTPSAYGLTAELESGSQVRGVDSKIFSRVLPYFFLSNRMQLPRCGASSAAITIVASQITFLVLFYSNPSGFSLKRAAVDDDRSWSGGIGVHIANLSRDFNYGLVRSYPGSAVSQIDAFPAYPDDPLVRQYSAEYWILGDLEAGSDASFARRVLDPDQADVVFVPFFAALSAEAQLRNGKGHFRHRKDNEDYERQRAVMEIVTSSSRWQRSGGRDHVFVLTDPMAMYHFRAEIANSILLVVDFGGWYMEDAKSSRNLSSPQPIYHTQVSLIKDVIVPYTHLLPTLALSQDNAVRSTLLYFKGARYRHRTGLVRDQLWSVLDGEPGVLLEEGFPNRTGQVQAVQGMRNSHFCLHPAGDTPSSCRLFDAVASLCIPVIVSDSIELPFEGMLDYTQFAIFVSVHDALLPKWLVRHLSSFSSKVRNQMRHNLASLQHHFEYENGFPGGRGAAIKDGAVNMIWRKVRSKLPGVREAIARDRRRPSNAQLPPARCQCI
ncbi:probable arabinosyltransferase ARAD1 [Selaginella moellendorffii]|nr:probable arabinosyltransferase ARAD1 [Selaginella moellendorffii]|eukprot:XP_002966467.2 probable arabinosyltransferase ARAD1 [Selaginella moellendorffii]